MNTPEKPRPATQLTVEELFEGATPELLAEMSREVSWAQEGAPVGREEVENGRQD